MIPLRRVTKLLETLADPTRLRLLHLLWRDQAAPWAVGELVDALGRPQPTISRHLAILRSQGLVRCASDGQQRLYSLADVQPRDHKILLTALAELVVETPTAVADIRRAPRLTSVEKHDTKESHMVSGDHEGDAAMSEVLAALSHPTRRRLLDLVGASPGATVTEVAERFDTSRSGVAKHLGVLERAGLVLSRRAGRARLLYQNAVPVQLIYDRWTTRFTAPLARHAAAIKYAVEESDRG